MRFFPTSFCPSPYAQRPTPAHHLHILTTPTAIPTPENAKNHTRGFAQGARTEEAHAAALQTAMLLARTAFRVHADSAFCARVRAAYEAGLSAPTAAGTAGAGAASASVVGSGASRNSAPHRGAVDTGGGTK